MCLTSLKEFRELAIRHRGIWKPDRTFSAKCEYIDDYHAPIGSEVYHMCQFVKILERGGVCHPELETNQVAWKNGWNRSLAVDCSAGAGKPSRKKGVSAGATFHIKIQRKGSRRPRPGEKAERDQPMSSCRLTLAEKETVILWDNEPDMAEVYIHDARLAGKLRELSRWFPDAFVLREAGSVRDLPRPQAVRGHPSPVQ